MMDLHCHLDLFEDPRTLIRECEAQGIYVLGVTTTPSAWNGSLALVHGSRRIRLGLGLHPELAAERKHEIPLFEQLLPETAYVGEVGLDGSREHRDHIPDQTYVFEAILDACARESGRILSVHSRGAATQVLDLLAAHPDAGHTILHWFSGAQRALLRAIDMGCWFSVGEPMLRSKRGRQAILRMPRDRVLIETDGPFAKGSDGRTLSPLDAPRALGLLASLWEVDYDEARAVVRSGFRDLVTKSHTDADAGDPHRRK